MTDKPFTPVHSESAPVAIGPYSQAVTAQPSRTTWLSGQIALHPHSGELVNSSIDEEIGQVLDNLTAVCEAAGGNLSHIVRFTVYLTDLDHFSAVNEAMQARLSEPYAARAAIGVAALPRGARVEIDGIMISGV